MWGGGGVFADVMSSYRHVEHQLGFSSIEIIRAKQTFEQLGLERGVTVGYYLVVSKARTLTQHIIYIQKLETKFLWSKYMP